MRKPHLILSALLLLLCAASSSSGSKFRRTERIDGICLPINLHNVFRRRPAKLLLSMLPPPEGEHWKSPDFIIFAPENP